MPINEVIVNVKPAEGPVMLVGEPLNQPTTFKTTDNTSNDPSRWRSPRDRRDAIPIGIATQATTMAAPNSVSMPVVNGRSAFGLDDSSKADWSLASCCADYFEFIRILTLLTGWVFRSETRPNRLTY